jgi:hypothetical protein
MTEFNINSKTHAIGWAYLMNFLGTKDIKYTDLIPLQNDETITVNTNKGYNSPTQKTLDTLESLIRDDRLPRKVMIALVSSGVLAKLNKR